MIQPQSSSIFGAEMADLAAIVRQAGEPPYRARQLFEAMYGSRVESLR